MAVPVVLVGCRTGVLILTHPLIQTLVIVNPKLTLIATLQWLHTGITFLVSHRQTHPHRHTTEPHPVF